MKSWFVLVFLILFFSLSQQIMAAESSDATFRKIKIYQRIVDQNPKNIEVANALGYALAWQGQFAEAEAVFRKSLSIRHRDRDTLLGLATVLFWAQKYQESENITVRLLDSFPHDVEALGLQKKVHDAKKAAEPVLTLRVSGLLQDFSFAESAGGTGISANYEKHRTWALRGGLNYIDKFSDQAPSAFLGASYWLSRATPLSLDVTLAPDQLVVPEYSVAVQVGHSFNRFFSSFVGARFQSYSVVDVNAFSIGGDFYPTPKLAITPQYTLSHSQLASAMTNDHSEQINLNWNVFSDFWLRGGYAHTEESFESGNVSTGQFAAHHVLAGARFNAVRQRSGQAGFGFDFSVDAENRDNGTTATTVEAGVSAAW